MSRSSTGGYHQEVFFFKEISTDYSMLKARPLHILKQDLYRVFWNLKILTGILLKESHTQKITTTNKRCPVALLINVDFL